MAYNYTVPQVPQVPNCCPLCASYHSSGGAYSQPSVSNPCCCCYSQCCCCQQHGCLPTYQQPNMNSANMNSASMNSASMNSASKSPPRRRNKLTRSHSSCAMGVDASGDAAGGGKGARNRNSARKQPHHSPYKCCSSSRPAVRPGAQERGRRQSQPRYLPAPSCDINRLMSMVRNPSKYEVAPTSSEDEDYATTTNSATTTTSTEPTTDCTDSDLPYDTEPDNDAQYTLDMRRHYRNMNTRVKFLPPTSCFMLVKRADQNRLTKTDRQVQCCFDISSDFCSCSKEVCEFCAKKIVCTCPRIRCCMCAKLKSTADRKAHVVSVCRCPKTYRCCEMATTFLRFNSSPALTQGCSAGFECQSARDRPCTL